MTRSMTVITILFSNSWKYSFLRVGVSSQEHGEILDSGEKMKKRRDARGTHTKSKLDISLIFNQSYVSHKQLASIRPSSCSPPNHSNNVSIFG